MWVLGPNPRSPGKDPEALTTEPSLHLLRFECMSLIAVVLGVL